MRAGAKAQPRARARQDRRATSSAGFAEQRVTWFADGTRLESTASRPRNASAASSGKSSGARGAGR